MLGNEVEAVGLRILMVCQHYWPEHFQITEICEELVRRGHEVTALVGIPNYPTGVVPEEYRNGKNREMACALFVWRKYLVALA